MGTKSGQFKSRNGRTYTVAFTGDSVSNGYLLLGVPPVVLSMAPGEHKFCGFKSTTATINILTDTPLLDLYSDRVDGIEAKVTDDTDEVVFIGFVVPFAFDQPNSGCMDSVTINAVDVITARKDVTYTNVGDEHGTDRTAQEIVQAICARAGIKKLIVHNSYNDSNDMMASASPLDVMVAQAGFLQDEVSDTDALSAICQFFGYTGHLVGDTLYLYDESCMSIRSANYYTKNIGDKWSQKEHYTGSASPITAGATLNSADIDGDVSVSIERAYDGIQITPSGSSVSVLLPDICAEENTEDNTNSLGTSTRTYSRNTDDADYFQERTPRQSKVMDLGLDNGRGGVSDTWSSVGGDPVVENTWNNGSMLLKVKHVARERFSRIAAGKFPAINVTAFNTKKDGNMVWMSGIFEPDYIVGEGPAPLTSYTFGKHKESAMYSHTGGYAKLSITWLLMRKGNWIDMTSDDGQEKYYTGDFGEMCFVDLTCGDERFINDSVWGTMASDAVPSVFLTKKQDYTLLPTAASLVFGTSETLVKMPNSGQVRVDLRVMSRPAEFFEDWNIYIESLSLEGYGKEVDTECADMRHMFNDKKDGEVLSVDTMLTTRRSDCKDVEDTSCINARPGVVTGATFSGYYRSEGSKQIPMSGVLMQQLTGRYATKRLAYTMTANKRVYPFRGISYLRDFYTVEAYDWNIEDNTTKITIN